MVLRVAVKAHKRRVTVPLRQRELLSLFVRKKVGIKVEVVKEASPIPMRTPTEYEC